MQTNSEKSFEADHRAVDLRTARGRAQLFVT
jgi:hypothetical protein